MTTSEVLDHTTQPPPTRHRPRRRRWLVGLAVTVLVLLLAFFAGGGWYFSGQVESDLLDASDSPTTYDLVAVREAGPTVRIETLEGAQLADVLRTDAVYGLQTEAGDRLVVTDLVDEGPDWVVRAIAPRDGEEFFGGADLGALPGSGFVLTGSIPVNDYREIWDVPSDIGMRYSEVVIDSDEGPLPAWLVPGNGQARSTWAVMVHGKGHKLSEPLRSLVAVNELGMTGLVVSYRNDAGTTATPDGHYDYGTTEWRDLQANVRYALDQGATDVVLFGYSMGGAVVASFLENSPLADVVSAVVLDSPMVDVKQTVSHGADQRTLPVVGLPIPDTLVWSALQISRLRFGSDWYDADYLDDTGWVTVPTLVFQGTEDDTVPPTTSDQLAAAEPELVTLVLTQGADHVESWNVDPTGYTLQLAAFLESALR